MKDTILLIGVIVLLSRLKPVQGVAFYSFGNGTRDLTLPRQDDAFTTIPLSFDLPFFGGIYREIHVSTNGIIFFGQGSTQYVPSPFPLNGTKCVAAYWVDNDPRFGGDVYYRELFDADQLTSISNEIRSKFINRANFRASWAFIVTFDDVPRFGCSSNNSCNKVVKHQTILASNGIESFVIFLYEKLGYDQAQIGFNAGDGKRYFMVPYSNTVNSSVYALSESNVGEPGKWIFGITSEISSACDSRGLLAVFPRKVLHFGGQEITMTGPCFESNETMITVMFGATMVNCQVIENLKIVCTSPYIDILGRIQLTFQYGSIHYFSFIIAHDESDEMVTTSQIDLSTNAIDSSFMITWNNSLSEQSTNNLLLGGVQEDILIDSNGNVIQLNRQPISEIIPNTGSYEFRPTQFLLNKRNVGDRLRKISIFIGMQNYLVKVITRTIINVVAYSCDIWHSNQPNTQQINEIVDRESGRNPCQPSVPWNFPVSLPGNFEIDDACNPYGNNWCTFFHPGAKGCYRSTNNPNDIAVQCCYNGDNQLLIGPPGGGTLDMHDSKNSKFMHFMRDVLPYLLCCKLQSKCDKYYEKRPSINSTFFVPPVVRRANGDPHFVTMDDTHYDFNPVGEFIFLQAPNLTVQTRITQYFDNGQPKPASYFSAFAIKAFRSDVILIELTAVQTMQVKVGNAYLYSGTWSFQSFGINNSDSSFVSVETSQGFKLEVQAMNGMLHAIVMLSQSFKGNVAGLVGNWDDNPENDFMLPNGTFIPRNSSSQDIHYLFGMQWTTTESTSLFSYPAGLSWRDFQNPTFTPFFGTPTSDPRCNGDRDCLFDLQVTGNINVSLSNIKIKQRANDVEQLFQAISETCMVNINIANGFVRIVSNLSDLTNVEYKISCDTRYELSGNEVVKCIKGKYSQDFGTCQKAVEMPSIGSNYKQGMKPFAVSIMLFLVNVLQ